MIPPKLHYGDTIATFSPSSPITAITVKRYDRAKLFLQNRGFTILEGALTGKRDFYRSGSISERADELNMPSSATLMYGALSPQLAV